MIATSPRIRITTARFILYYATGFQLDFLCRCRSVFPIRRLLHVSNKHVGVCSVCEERQQLAKLRMCLSLRVDRECATHLTWSMITTLAILVSLSSLLTTTACCQSELFIPSMTSKPKSRYHCGHCAESLISNRGT